MRRVPAGFLDHLDPACTRADDAHALAGEVETFLWPLRGVMPLSAETLQAFKGWNVGL